MLPNEEGVDVSFVEVVLKKAVASKLELGLEVSF